MLRLDQGDNRASLRAMIARGEFVHSVVTDPPYGLVSVNKRFGKEGSAPAKFGSDGLYARQSKGFMGKLWDGSGIERDPEFWRLVYDVMLPGAYIVAFSSSRTYGYMQIAMEAAGFITHPMLGWTFASGFPKAHNAAQAIEKQLTMGVARRPDRDLGGLSRDRWSGSEEGTLFADTGGHIPLTTLGARAWDGWSYGGQSLKPALEPIYVGQKPFSEKNGALNILKHGVGALNIDGCRIHAADAPAGRLRHGGGVVGNATSYEMPDSNGPMPAGRWPANLLHDGSPEVVALFPDSKGAAAPASGPTQIGEYKSGSMAGHFKGTDVPPPFYGDGSGSAARFFNSFPHEGPLLHYPKASKKDRAGSKHATVKPIALMQHLVRLVTPPGGTVLDPFAGSGTTGSAATPEGMSCVMMEAEQEYIRDICRRFDLDPGTRNRLWQVEDAVTRMTEAL